MCREKMYLLVIHLLDAHTIFFFWWVLQHCTGFARLVWGRLRVHRAFIHSDWFVCSVCFCSLLPRLTLLLSFLDILHCLPRAVGVPLESALNLVSRMSTCHTSYGTCECLSSMWVLISVEDMRCVATGWRRLIGCLKLQVNFRKRTTNYRALLR